MNLIEILNRRYSTKEFNPDKKLSDADFEQIKALLRMSPSSTNSQPWHFIIADTKAGKQRIAKGADGFYKFNKQKVLDASHVIVFCSKTHMDENYMLHLLENEEKDGRFPDEQVKKMVYGARNIFADLHRYDLKDLQHWMEKQVYLNMGTLLLGAAALNIDALPMEGFDFKLIDEEFNLRKKGYTAVAVVALGYRSETDFNATTAKSRLLEDEIFTILK